MSDKEKLFTLTQTEVNTVQNTSESSTVTDNPFILAEENEEYKRLEKEFNDYKRRKALSRIDSLLVSGYTLGDFKEELNTLKASSKAVAVVLPAQAEMAKKELPPVVRLEILVDFPFACSTKKSVLAEIKAGLQKKATVCVALSLATYSSGNKRPLEKWLKIIKRKGKGGRVIPMFSIDALSNEQISRLALLIRANGFSSVKLISGDNTAKTADAVKCFFELFGERCPVGVVGKISTAEQAEELFSAGTDRIISTDYRTLKRQKIDNITV